MQWLIVVSPYYSTYRTCISYMTAGVLRPGKIFTRVAFVIDDLTVRANEQ